MSKTTAELSWVVSIDAGGTFTDAVATSDQGDVLLAKVDSTPDDPARGLLNSLDELEAQGVVTKNIQLFGHGTTVATNAMLTGNVAEAMLFTTLGFRDIMGYRQQIRPSLYSLTPDRPQEIIQRYNCIEVNERLNSAGQVLNALGSDELDRIVRLVRDRQPSSIAVSLLFSYLNDVHERLIGERLREEFPDLPVTLSSEVAREFREYPRTATTVINAALRPRVEGYLGRARQSLSERGITSPIVVMQSNGGCVNLEDAGRQTHQLLLSGPAGGVAGVLGLANEHGLDNVISFDMGGTSLDICLIKDQVIPVASQQQVLDHTLLAPTVDIHTIGAGGGSIAWVDESGRLRVGPQSAGANPGPAAYGRGGTKPTITDAHVVLGTLGTEALAGGLALDKELAYEAISTIAPRLEMSVEDAADAILAITLADMIRAVRKVSIERGIDPRLFTLVPFGGAGPLHASLVLRHMGLQAVLLPARPGVFAANGLLTAGLRIDESQTVLMENSDKAASWIATWFSTTQSEMIEQLLADSVRAEDIVTSTYLDCRYRGQGYEIPVAVESYTSAGVAEAVDSFHLRHAELYGHSDRSQSVEIVTVRATVQGVLLERQRAAISGRDAMLATHAVVAERPIRFPGTFEAVMAKVYDRDRLKFGNIVVGPAILAQMDATTVLLEGQTAEVLETGDILLKEQANA